MGWRPCSAADVRVGDTVRLCGVHDNRQRLVIDDWARDGFVHLVFHDGTAMLKPNEALLRRTA